MSSAVHHNVSSGPVSGLSPRDAVWAHLRVLALPVQLRGQLFQLLERFLALLCRLLQQVVVYAPSILAIRL